MTTFYSHGKLLLTGEYAVLDGAEALALPTQQGQSLTISEYHEPIINWISKNQDDTTWFTTQISLDTLTSINQKENEDIQIAQTLSQILITARKLNSAFLLEKQGVEVITKLEFDRSWGLGSSSTLINNIAQWAQVNAFELLEKSFGGSGYDIACAQHRTPIIYQRSVSNPSVVPVSFKPKFKDQLYFVYLNKKKSSKEAIRHYRSLSLDKRNTTIKKFTRLTNLILEAANLPDFEKLLNTHESQLSALLQTPTVKSTLFSTYPYTIKSLGGWGGDFVLITTRTPQNLTYFKERGFTTIIPFTDMILKEES